MPDADSAPPIDARADLARCLSPLTTVASAPGSLSFRGAIRASASLAGPPARLHGGLHPSVRLLLPFEALTSASSVRESRLAMDVRVRRSIALDETVPIEGTLVTERDGSKTLTTRTAGTSRLDATLRSDVPDESPSVLDRFRRSLAADREDGESSTLVGEGQMPFEASRRLVTFRIDAPFSSRRDFSLSRFLGPGRTIDPTFTCAALDVVGAYALGMNLRSRLYTTNLALVVNGCATIDDMEFVLLGDRRGVDVPGSELEKVAIGEQSVGEQRAEVLLADASLTRAFGYGSVSLVPVRATAAKP